MIPAVENEASDPQPLGAGWHFAAESFDVPSNPPVHWGKLGQGWEFADAALALVQADLSRTVADAPTLGFAWHEDRGRGRVVYIGKGPDWYGGAHGAVFLGTDVATAVTGIAEAVQDAMVDNLLGYRTFWPKCPHDGGPVAAQVVNGQARWLCDRGVSHDLGAVGELRLD